MVEQGCYILNSLPFEGARSLLMGGFKEPEDKVKVMSDKVWKRWFTKR